MALDLGWAGDTLAPADGLREWLRRVGFEQVAEQLEQPSLLAEDRDALALLERLWQARCRGVDLSSLAGVLRAAAVVAGAP